MRALVTVASRHNATLEIGEVVADTIREHGIECDLIVPEDVTSVAEYDVVIVGSAIYTGRWLPEARELVERLTAELQTKTVWLFSSAETHERMIASGAVAHRHFSGRLDLNVLNFAERAIIAAARGKQGDRRDMDAVREWARSIVAHVQQTAGA
jgi:menaquinone-dependent protoporphyrinogen oxidase